MMVTDLIPMVEDLSRASGAREPRHGRTFHGWNAAFLTALTNLDKLPTWADSAEAAAAEGRLRSEDCLQRGGCGPSCV